jgi:mannose/fructose/N-acetylgalactosamine-specific phosphotransferase system component IIC
VPFLLIGNLAFKIRGFTTGATSKIEFQPLWFDLMGVALVGAGLAGIYYVTRNLQAPAVQQAE